MRIPLFALILIASPAWGQSLEDLRVHPTARELEVSFRVEDAFTDKLEERVQSGLPTAFIFQFDLLRDRKHWWDDYLRSATLELVAMYNAVSQEYLLNIKQNGKLVESRTARSLGELERIMTRIQGWPVFRLDDLPAGTRLLIKARARLGGKTYLDLVPVNVTTDWVSSRKFLVPGSDRD